jgi:hypothetical protein
MPAGKQWGTLMANDDKSGTNLANGGAIIAAVAAMGVYYFHHEAPLVDLRPAPEARMEEPAQPQTVEARLWQDPFAALEKSRDKAGKQDPEQQCRENPVESPCKAPLKEGDHDTLVLGVTVPGGPYPEDAEHRRRTRYAVVAGLKQAGFVPKDARHIDYFVWRQLAPSLVLETPSALRLLSWGMQPARNLALTSVASQLPLFGLLQDYRLQDVWPSGEATLVPYERFEEIVQRGQDGGAPNSIIVLWLREDALRGEPLASLTALMDFLRQDGFDGSYIRIVGPFSSDILNNMVVEARKEAPKVDNGVCDDNGNKKSRWPKLEYVKFYAFGASAADDQLLKTFGNGCHTVRRYLKQFGIDLQRTIATDDALATGIVNELKRRRITPDASHKDDIALISEWDTLYGQTLPLTVEHEFVPDGLPHSWIHKFTYLRGLDGLLPANGKEDQKQDKATTSEQKQGSTTDFFKVEADTQSLERPIGQSQYDYLRRISENLHKVDDKLRKDGGDKKIKAIGILGGDVFDKLLILRALHPEFPEALFFTTDFDEAFTIKSELPFTRNLIISSSYGPNLSNWLQGEIPFFRDTYETSAFLATQLALGDLHNNLETPEYLSSDISDQLHAPRLFEVKRNGQILPFAWKPASPAPEIQNHDGEDKDNRLMAGMKLIEEGRSESIIEWPCSKTKGISKCGNIQPVDPEELKKHPDPDDPKPIEELFPTFETTGRIKLGGSLAVGAFLTFTLLYVCKIPKGRCVEFVLFGLGLVVGAVACFFWDPLAQFLTERGDGEPFAMLDGISVWPTVLLRGGSIVLAGYFIWRALRNLNEDLVEITQNMKLEPVPEPLESQFKSGLKDRRSLREKLVGLFDFSLGSDPPTELAALQVNAAWKAYVCQERLWSRCIRAAIYTLGLFLFGMFVLVPMFGRPMIPARGDLAFKWYMRTMYGDVILMQFLCFFIFDATLFCLLFVNKLRRAQTQWPPTTAAVYKGDLRLQTKLVHDWIDLDFVAKRTHCIGSLIYYPFVLIALLIVSRSRVFADYPPSLTILIAQGISLSVVFGCAFMLWWSAKAARDTAKQHLTDGIIRAKDKEGNVYLAGQLEALLNRVDQLNDGAFRPFSQQPLVRALLFPLSSAGGIALIENGMLPGL